jgi:peptidylprolyl isomerase
MLKRSSLLSVAGAVVLLASSVACGQEGYGSKETNKAKKAPVEAPTAPQKTSGPEYKEETALSALEAPTGDKESSSTTSPEELKKVSEAFGHFIGKNLKTPGLNFDLDSIITGIRNGYAGKPSPMTDKEYEEAMTKMQEQAFKQMSSNNLKAANEFLAKNAKADKVIEVEPGKLQYLIIQEGNGAKVEEHFSPQIQYTGKFLDGSTFGSSTETGGPITVPLDQTIPGFSKGIVGMKEGEKRTLFVHPELGYGTSGHLPPNSLLIFDIEVVKANAPETTENADDELSDLSLSDEEQGEEGDELEEHNPSEEEPTQPRETVAVPEKSVEKKPMEKSLENSMEQRAHQKE